MQRARVLLGSSRLSMTPREAELTRLLEQAVSALARAERENELLRQKIDLLIRRVFGASSERLDSAQLELVLADGHRAADASLPEVSPLLISPERAPTRPRAERLPRLPRHLPVVEEIIDPEPVKAAPEQWRCIGQEVSEQLDDEPGRFLRRRTIRKKYVPRKQADAAPVIAPLPERLLDRSLPAPGLLAAILVAKYCDHLPLYRQEQMFRTRHQVLLPRQTLARWVGLAAQWLKPVYEHIRTGVMAGGYAQVDETPIRSLEPGHGKARQGYFWTGSRPGGDVVFRWETSRAAACLEQLIPVDFAGTLQCDGFSAYPAFARERAGAIALAGCWAHVRRKFVEALESAPRTAGWVLRQIQHLYRIEKRLREKRSSPRWRAVIRAQESRILVERLGQACERLRRSGRHLPQSLLGSALDYTLGQWSTLTVFLEDGRIEIDNNLVENAIRPTALGKKNWLFIGEAGAGERSAILYTIIESCRRRSLDPYAYLRDVLTRLPRMTNRQVPEIIPSAWSKSRPITTPAKAS